MIVRPSSQAQKENCSSTRQGRRDLAATANEKIPTRDFTDMELRVSILDVGSQMLLGCINTSFPVSQIRDVRVLFLSVT